MVNRRLPSLEKLSEHDFIQGALSHSVPFMVPDLQVSDYIVGTRERYIGEVGYYVGQILNQLERIDQAGLLINSYPYIKAWRIKYGRFEYFQYHMEQYFIAVAGLMDRLLLLINQLYRMDINDELVRFSKISKELKMRNNLDLDHELVTLRDSMRNIKQLKNGYTHSIRFWEKELWLIGVREFALRNNTIDDPKNYLREDILFDSREYRSEKMKIVLKNEKAIYEMMTKIYDLLNQEYLSRLERSDF